MSLKNLSEPHYNGSLFAHDNFIVCKCRIFWLTTADLQEWQIFVASKFAYLTKKV